MAALNNLESGFNAKLVLSKSHEVSRALSLTQWDKTIHNQFQSSDYSYPRHWSHCFVYPISPQVAWKQAHPQRQNCGTSHIIGTRGHGVDLRWGEIRRTQNMILLPERHRNQVHPGIAATHSQELRAFAHYSYQNTKVSYFLRPILSLLFHIPCFEWNVIFNRLPQ